MTYLTMEAFHRGITPPAQKTLDRYGITQDEWLALLLNQGWVCPICEVGNVKPSGKKTVWNTDHEHVPKWESMPPEERKKYVRGVLCHHCNHRKVGNHRDADLVQRIADYLKSYEARKGEQ